MTAHMHSSGSETQPQYNAEVTDLFQRTPFAGGMDPGPGVFVGSAGSALDGAEVRFWLKSGGGLIQEISFRAYGCPHTIAAAAWVAHQARGLTLKDVEHTTWLEVERALAIPPRKRGRLLIVEDALKAAVKAAAGNV